MKNSDSIETNSRRQFTRTILTAAVAAPILASIAGCKGTTEPTPPGGASPSGTTGASTTGLCTPVEKTGYTEIDFPQGILEEHIPPMLIGGGGSLIIDSKNKLKEEAGGVGMGPFNYVEDGVADAERYGVIRQILVIEELAEPPLLKVTLYKGFLSPGTGTQLLLWYQDISPSPVDPLDTTYPAATFPADPDIRVVGGKGANTFKMVVKKKRLDPPGLSHKPGRPHSLKHSNGGLLARHFRIGKWRLEDSAGATLVETQGADNYTFHMVYDHFTGAL
jgi:hypothetical protein